MRQEFKKIKWVNVVWTILITINIGLALYFLSGDRFDHATFHITLANMFLVFMCVDDIKNDIKEIKYRIWFRQDKYERDREVELRNQIRAELKEEEQNQGVTKE